MAGNVPTTGRNSNARLSGMSNGRVSAMSNGTRISNISAYSYGTTKPTTADVDPICPLTGEPLKMTSFTTPGKVPAFDSHTPMVSQFSINSEVVENHFDRYRNQMQAARNNDRFAPHTNSFIINNYAESKPDGGSSSLLSFADDPDVRLTTGTITNEYDDYKNAMKALIMV